MAINKFSLSSLLPRFNGGHRRQHGTTLSHTMDGNQSNALTSRRRETSSLSTEKNGKKPTYVNPGKTTTTTTWNYTPTIRYGYRSKDKTTKAPRNHGHRRNRDEYVYQYQGYFDPSSKHLVPKDSMYSQSWF